MTNSVRQEWLQAGPNIEQLDISLRQDGRGGNDIRICAEGEFGEVYTAVTVRIGERLRCFSTGGKICSGPVCQQEAVVGGR